MKPRRILALFVIVVVATSVYSCSTVRYTGPVSDHFDGRKFYGDVIINKSSAELWRWRVTREPGEWEFRELAAADVPPASVSTGVRASFVNHATTLLQLPGTNLLTDPIWSKRTGPGGRIGPKRYTPPGIAFDDLPSIDVVVVSHNHYDHMDLPTLARLADAHPVKFIVPLGNSHSLKSAGIARERIVELDWWQTHSMKNGLRVTAVPAQHWSRRAMFDSRKSLWAGFVVEQAAQRIYYAGDTGMSPHFAAIRARLGEPTLALLPIGAYQPRWFMREQHIDPAEAVKAFELLGAQRAMAVHFTTFALGDDGQDTPARDLRAALAAAGLDETVFWIPTPGEARSF